MHFMIVEDHPLYREALHSTLQLAFPGARVEEAGSIEAAVASLEGQRGADLILLDLSMLGVNGFDGLVSIRRRFPSVPVLVVSGLDEPRIIQDAMRFGAAGFVPKASGKATIVQAISAVLSGTLVFPQDIAPGVSATPARGPATLAERIAQLTPQQLRVLKMIRQGKLNKQIAHELLVGDSTVKAHVSEILRKLGVMSRTQIVIETASLNFDRPH
jgi:DNA-binding NarL/FixJ family response regulator